MSIADAKTEVFNLFAEDTDGTPVEELASIDVQRVHWNEPGPSNVASPVGITVSTLGTGALSPDFYRVAVRIYVSPRADVIAAQDKLDDVIETCEDLLTALFARSEWATGYNVTNDVLVAETFLEMSR